MAAEPGPSHTTRLTARDGPGEAAGACSRPLTSGQTAQESVRPPWPPRDRPNGGALITTNTFKPTTKNK